MNTPNFPSAPHIHQHIERSLEQQITSSHQYDTKCSCLQGALPLMYVSSAGVLKTTQTTSRKSSTKSYTLEDFQEVFYEVLSLLEDFKEVFHSVRLRRRLCGSRETRFVVRGEITGGENDGIREITGGENDGITDGEKSERRLRNRPWRETALGFRKVVK
ncbi:hypothetical protein DY000_02013595 [Brassica cretica]|uniref:Uncharacterized protein n=1 Tax=Brassica cretica TaxID=69181 RepID=A0ABQ7D9P2_BRACR|nr:hypothetical protein DY000_02013595 [Brassica cretica]